MTTQEMLLAAILADPDDDLPRLAYADWLEEVGQIDYAGHLRRCLARPNQKTYGAPPWASHLLFELYSYVTVCSRRGFVEYVNCPLQKWLFYGPEVVQLQPITMLHISDRLPAIEMVNEASLQAHWFFVPTNTHAFYHCLPDELLAHLLPSPSKEGRYLYSSSSEAMADMSRACLAWAKQKARREAAT